jgi:D-arginine dehydrogenase
MTGRGAELERFDVIVVGGGMSGASAACEIARSARVLLLERESMPGFHSTGRSAAAFIMSYGHDVAALRWLTQASESFLKNPPPGFCAAEILKPREFVTICEPSQVGGLQALYEEIRRLFPHHSLLTQDELRAKVPRLTPDFSALGLLDPDVYDIEVHTLHDGYLRGLRRQGGTARFDSEIQSVQRQDGEWRVAGSAGTFAAPILVNAAGAWTDTIAKMAGVRPAGIQPLRRTAVLVSPPPGDDVRDWPMLFDFEGRFYVKPDAGMLLASPADETPSPPCDAQPEDLDVAIAVDFVERAFGIDVTRVGRKWAGLRCFAADRAPVVGFDDEAEGFFWLAGHGGHGIQIAPATSRLAAALVAGLPVPDDLARLGFDAELVSPARPSLQRAA